MTSSSTCVDVLYYNLDPRHASETYNGTMFSKLRFEFPSFISRRENVTMVRAGVDHAMFPVSFYNINENNCHLHMRDAYLGEHYYIEVPHGNYTATNLCQYLQDNLPSFTISVSAITGKMTIVSSHEWGMYPSSLYPVIGAREDFQYGAGPGQQLFLPFPMNLMGINKLLLHTNLPCKNRDSNGQPFLLSVNCDAPPFGQIVYDNATNDSCLMPMDYTTDHLDIGITDEDGNLVNFNNIPWQLTLFVEYHSERPDEWIYSLTDVLKSYETTIQQIKEEVPVSHGYNLRRKKRDRKDGEKTETG